MPYNRARAVELMQQCDLDALVASSPVNVFYLSGYDCWLDPLNKEYMGKPGASGERAFQNFAVLPRQGDPLLVVPGMFAVNAGSFPVQDITSYGMPPLDRARMPLELAPYTRSLLDVFDSSPFETSSQALVAALEKRGLHRGRIGLELEGMPLRTRRAVEEGLGRAEIRDCTNLLRLVRAVKTAEEIERLAEVTRIGEEAAHAALACARAGQPIRELARCFGARAAERGAAVDHFAYGVRGLGIGLRSPYTLAARDILYVDYGCIADGYISDSGLTLALDLSPEMSECYTVVSESISAGVEALRPGILSSEVQAAMQARFASFGTFVGFPHGHGIGLELRDYPILVPRNGLAIQDDCVDVSSDLPLEPGMVVNLEASIFIPDVGSLNREQSFVITAGGSRPLVPQERSIPVQPLQ